MATNPSSPPSAVSDPRVDQLAEQLQHQGPHEAAALLTDEPTALVIAVLRRLNPAATADVLAHLPAGRRAEVFAQAPSLLRQQWETNQQYPEGTIGRLMDPPVGTFAPGLIVAEAVEQLRDMALRAVITYGYVVDEQEHLLGVLVMRDMLLADPQQRLDSLMIRNPFALAPQTTLMEAMKQVVNKHFPVYPVCEGGKLVGLVRGQTLFEQQAVEITAQAGAMVGVDREERATTPWTRSLLFRHPWLQLNLLTAFVAAAVVGVFQDTINEIVVLAVFLPVLAGQCGNTGCQALAVTLRGMTLGELKPGSIRRLFIKEAILGTANGALVGISAGAGMFITVRMQGGSDALLLALVVWMAMTGACVLSGICGVFVPMALKRCGADPATASSIFLTTATDVASMGMFLGLAAILVARG